MDQQLPPPALVTTWLNVIHSKNIPNDIIIEDSRILCYYYGSIELANVYVEQNGFNQNKASIVVIGFLLFLVIGYEGYFTFKPSPYNN